MKTLPIRLMIALALGLCVLIWFQWLREGRSQATIRALTDTQQNLKAQMQSLAASLKTSQAEVVRLDELQQRLHDQMKTNAAYTASLLNSNDLLRREVATRLKQAEAYQEAFEEANHAIKRQNADVAHQNAEMKRLVEERNEVAQKYSQAVTSFNELADKWNTLNAELAAAATNSAAQPPKPAK